MKKQPAIVLSKEERADIAEKVRVYVESELEADISNLQSELFTDFITEKIGIYYYNKAIADAAKYMSQKAEDLYGLTKI